MLKGFRYAACVGVGLLASTASADVRLAISNGQVSLSAKDATVAQILAEWAIAGPARIVNADRVGGGLVTMELSDVPEAQALDIILRSAAAGYVLAPRQAPGPNGSRFDRILILPPGAARPAALAVPPPVFSPPPFNPAPSPDAVVEQPDLSDQPAAAPASPRPVFRTFPQPTPPRTDPPPSAAVPFRPTMPGGMPTLTAPAGVSTPGMIPPAPAAPAASGESEDDSPQ